MFDQLDFQSRRKLQGLLDLLTGRPRRDYDREGNRGMVTKTAARTSGIAINTIPTTLLTMNAPGLHRL